MPEGSMASQKIENLLNLALETPENEREKSQNLNVGFDTVADMWDVIVRYHGDIQRLEELDERIRVVELYGGYGILTLPQELVETVAGLREIEYMEKPKRLYFELSQARSAACITQVQEEPFSLAGQGTIVAVIDSGIDYEHPDFRNTDGSTRILALWDQTIEGNPPQGYRIGTEYTREDINRALESTLPMSVVPSTDTSTHGTHVAGIAAGNGRASQGRYRGVAPQAQMIVVKLGVPRSNSFPRTSELMQAVDYVIRRAGAYGMPAAVNISFGNTYGAHNGTSLLETYLNTVSNVWKNVIVTGTGNEGAAAGHTSGTLVRGARQQVMLAVSAYEPTLNVQIWKDYADIFRIWLISPSGERRELGVREGTQRFQMGMTQLLVYYGRPSPYSAVQEIYIDFLPVGDFVDSGVWSIELEGIRVITGDYEMWIPSGAALNEQTEFLYPSQNLTITIPSTASRVISVAAYDSRTNSYADFSGRGYVGRIVQKPDIAAPGVDIVSTAPGGGYSAKSGTSMATPFVTGAAALLMQYGIVQGQDAYLYGEKIKAYLRRGARQLPVTDRWPNNQFGWGVLCLRDSLP